MPIKDENYKIIRRHIFKLLGNQCAFCGSTEELELDHIIPNGMPRRETSRSERIWEWIQAFDAGNLQILCKKCNIIKGDR